MSKRIAAILDGLNVIDLPLAYGENHPLKKLPRDGGAACQEFKDK